MLTVAWGRPVNVGSGAILVPPGITTFLFVLSEEGVPRPPIQTNQLLCVEWSLSNV